jgi:hypothetical protein
LPIQNTALSETIKADEIAGKNTKSGKVTAVVAVISIFIRKRNIAER